MMKLGTTIKTITFENTGDVIKCTADVNIIASIKGVLPFSKLPENYTLSGPAAWMSGSLLMVRDDERVIRQYKVGDGLSGIEYHNLIATLRLAGSRLHNIKKYENMHERHRIIKI